MKLRTLISAIVLLSSTMAFSQVTLYVANDLGRNGYYQQKPIADLMGRMAENDGPEAILALGDVHHFEGVQSVNDPLWMTNYELIYSHPELMLPWYAIMGNHEYRGNTEAVLDYADVSRRWNMPGRYYSKTFDDDGSKVKVIFLDTTPLIDKYRNDSLTFTDASKQDICAQLTWLENELKSTPRGENIIVVGHHPIYAQTPKEASERSDMQQRVGAILEKYPVSLYINGHIHNFQDVVPKGSKIHYVTNSSGSLSRSKVKEIEGTRFVSGEPGFSRMVVDNNIITLDMINDKGEVIHRIVTQ